MKEYFRPLISKIIRSQGYDVYFANKISDELWRDLFEYKATTLRQKLWALRRGFFSDKIALYGLTGENVENYLPDLDYYRLFPINGMYGRWIDDKLTMKLILHPFSQYLPEYYFQVGDGEILRLPDCPETCGQTAQGVLTLLQERHRLAAKPQAGSQGVGFVRLGYEAGVFTVNNQPVPEQDVLRLVEDWIHLSCGGYLITEYLQPHAALSRIWPDTANTLRVMVVREPGQAPRVAGSFIRFGTSTSGSVDNTDLGGVACHVDIKNGSYSLGRIRKDGGWLDCPVHPDTGGRLAGEIPFWDLIRTRLIEISSYIPQVIYMGIDVVITDQGFKIIEINSHQGLRILQSGTPFYQNEVTKDFFKGLVDQKKRQLEYVRNQRMAGRMVRLVKKTAQKFSRRR